MKKIYFAFLIPVILLIGCKGNTEKLELHKPIPSYTFTDLLNSDQTSFDLGQRNGKALIIEFWATWCSPCVPAIKQLESYVNKYPDDLDVLTVSNDDRDRLLSFIKTTNLSLKVAYDTSHLEIFNYRFIPHTILINKKGIVKGITSADQVSEENILALIEGKELDMEVKNDFVSDSSEVKVIVKEADLSKSLILTGNDPRFGAMFELKKDDFDEVNGLVFRNLTLPTLFQELFQVTSFHRVIFDEGLTRKDFSYSPENQYNFIIDISSDLKDEIYEIGRNFLNQHLDVNGRMRYDSLEVFLLTKTESKLQPSQSDSVYFTFRGPVLTAKKIRLDQLIKYLENFTSAIVVDETGMNEEYDIDLNWQFEDPGTLHKELAKYGLKLEKAEKRRYVEVLEIYRKSSG